MACSGHHDDTVYSNLWFRTWRWNRQLNHVVSSRKSNSVHLCKIFVSTYQATCLLYCMYYSTLTLDLVASTLVEQPPRTGNMWPKWTPRHVRYEASICNNCCLTLLLLSSCNTINIYNQNTPWPEPPRPSPTNVPFARRATLRTPTPNTSGSACVRIHGRVRSLTIDWREDEESWLFVFDTNS